MQLMRNGKVTITNTSPYIYHSLRARPSTEVRKKGLRRFHLHFHKIFVI